MVYLKGAALFVMLLILAIEQSEGGVVGDCWESLSDCTNQNLDTGAGFLLVRKDACVLDTVKGVACLTPSIHAATQTDPTAVCVD